jgi:hypothetical protein
MRAFFLLSSFFLWTAGAVFLAPAVLADAPLTNAQRINRVRTLLADVDTRSTQQLISDLKASSSPEGQLQILEAVAQTYQEMVEQYEVATPSQKKWLHSMILLNVAYFQFGGAPDDENTTELNIAIRRKLNNYLPEKLRKDPRLFYSLNE